MAKKIMAYSIVERKMMEMLNPKAVKMKNGVWAWKGKDVHGHTLYKIAGGKTKPTL